MSVRVPRRLLSEQIEVKRHTSDGYGGSWQSLGEFPARVNAGTRFARDADGNVVTSEARVYFAPEADVAKQDVVVVDGREHTVMEVARRRGPNGKVSLIEVDVQ